MMKIKPEIKELVESPVSSVWVGTVDDDLNPDLGRVVAARMDEDKLELQLYMSKLYFDPLAKSLKPGRSMAFLMASVVDFTSYQIKGKYLDQGLCKEEDIEYLKKNMDGFSTELTRLGFVKEKVYAAYMFEPYICIVMSVEEIFEQSPRVGTGEKVSNHVPS